MVEITREDIDVLVQLQKAETDAVKIKSFLEGVESEKDALASQLAVFQEANEAMQRELDEISQLCRDAELEMKLNEERIEKSTQTLKTLTNHKAYAALQREVDDNKKRKEPLENHYLQLLEKKEAVADGLEEHTREFQQLREKIRGDQQAIDEKNSDHKARLEACISEKKRIAENLNPRLLRQFDEISSTSGGLAVVEVKDQLCRGCFLNIPPQLYIEVQRGNQLILCPQCNRILYYKEEA